MPNKVFVVGVGMTKFEKPGRREGWDYPDMARESGTNALQDAGIAFSEVQQGFVGYVAGDSTSGNRALYELGMTGIPIANVNNNCSTGSTALFLAAQTIRGGLADCAIALGFEKMQPGPLQGGADDRESPMGKHVKAMAEIDEFAFPVDLIGYDMNVQAAQKVYDQCGLGPSDFQVIELHDCFSANELLLYEALGLCGEGEAPKLIDNNDTTYGGRWVVNPSGGLISKGHPLGATGLAQCSELTWQLRGDADARQVEGAKVALQHNIGLGGAAVVTAYQRAER
jgi:acetyl-CoA acetyltransferase